jgi:diacylglycerol kinase
LLCGINLVALIFGQRFAKDYAGAAVLVNYFILIMVGVLTFHF